MTDEQISQGLEFTFLILGILSLCAFWSWLASLVIGSLGDIAGLAFLLTPVLVLAFWMGAMQ